MKSTSPCHARCIIQTSSSQHSQLVLLAWPTKPWFCTICNVCYHPQWPLCMLLYFCSISIYYVSCINNIWLLHGSFHDKEGIADRALSKFPSPGLVTDTIGFLPKTSIGSKTRETPKMATGFWSHTVWVTKAWTMTVLMTTEAVKLFHIESEPTSAHWLGC